jgi:hypothetical protein
MQPGGRPVDTIFAERRDMKTVAQPQATEELQPPLEPSDSGAAAPLSRVQPPSVLGPFFCPIINTRTSATLPSRGGFIAVEFICPRCGSKRWGTVGSSGICRQVTLEELEPGWVVSARCPFEWARADDWTVFRRAATGQPFTSAAELEQFVGP